MDILKKNQNISTTAGLTNLSTTISNGLQQFFMVTLSYYPRKFGGGRRGGEAVAGKVVKAAVAENDAILKDEARAVAEVSAAGAVVCAVVATK